MRGPVPIRCLIAASISVCTAKAFADNDAGTTSLQLQEIVVTAQKRAENPQDVPISIQAYNAAAIEELGIKSSTDLGQMTPNLQISLPSGAGNQPVISIRGIGLSNYDTNNSGPNGVYVDEVYQSAPSSQTFQVFDLDRIEVLKGPQGTLYGRNNSGGAINFIAAQPTDELTGSLRADYSSFDTLSLEGAVAGPLVQGLDGRIAFIKNHSSGYLNNALTGEHENGANDYAGRALLQYKPSDRLTIVFNLHGGQVDTRPNQYRHVGTLDPASGAPCPRASALAGHCVDAFGYGTPVGFFDGAFLRQEHLRVNSIGATIHVNYRLDSLTLTSISAYDHNDKLFPEDTDASPNRLLEVDYGVSSNTYTQELRVARALEDLNWVIGLYGLTERLSQHQPLSAYLDADNFYGPGSGDGLAQVDYDDNRQVSSAYAIFGQADHSLTDKLKLTVGGRFTAEKKSFRTVSSAKYQAGGIDNFTPVRPLWSFDESARWSAFSWRTALDYAFTQQASVYVSAATGFKGGAFNGGFLSEDPIEARQQLGPVRPEKVLAYEAGLKSEFQDARLLFNLAFFYNDYRDMQVFNVIPPVVPGGVALQVLSNAPKAHTQGMDLQLTGKPVGNLTVSLSAGLLATRIDRWNMNSNPWAPIDNTGHRLPNAPTTSLSAILDYGVALPRGNLDLQMNANYRSKQFFDVANDPLITQQAYWLENARIAYAFPARDWEIAAYVHNLSKSRYLTGATDLTNPFGFLEEVVGMPRTYGVQVKYTH